jgi:hypothetical protein
MIAFSQQRALLTDVFRGLLVVPFHGTKLRESKMVRMAFRSRELGFAGKSVARGRHDLVKDISA